MKKPLWVAELGSNHNGDVVRAVMLVDAAADTGFDAVKVQAFRADRLYRDQAKRDEVRPYELSIAQMGVLSEVAHKKNMLFGASVFDIPMLLELVATVPIDFLKIASYSLLDLHLIRAAAKTKKMLMIGTGMATAEEAGAAWKVAFEEGALPIMMHCVSQYPIQKPESCNLSAMMMLPRPGWSDHSVSMAVVLRAVHRWRAEVVELHFDIMNGHEAGHSWQQWGARRVMELVNDGLLSDGTGVREPQECELAERAWRADPADGLRPVMS